MKKILLFFGILLIILVISSCKPTKCTIKYIVDGKVVNSEVINRNTPATYGKDNRPHKENYEFRHWLVNGFPFDFNTKLNSDIELIASFVKLKVNVNYVIDLNGEKIVVDSKLIDKGTKLKNTNINISHPYYMPQSDLWYLNGKEFNFDNNINDSLTLTKQYTKRSFKIELHYPKEHKTISLPYHTDLSKTELINIPSLNNYKLIGWFEAKLQKYYSSLQQVLLNDDLSLYPIYSYDGLEPSWDVTYQFPANLNISIKVKKESTMPHILQPIKQGYIFTNWIDQSNITINNLTKINNNLVLKPVFKINNNEADFSKICTLHQEMINGTTGYFVTGLVNNSLTSLTIPDYYNDLPIIGIDAKAFANNETLQEVVIGDNVKYILQNAFANMKALESIYNIDNVIDIKDFCFAGCEKLSNIQLPTNSEYTKLNQGLFKNCFSLSYIDLPASIKQIGVSCFEGCKNLYKVRSSSDFEIIGKKAFKDCNLLNTFNLGSKLININASAFENCFLLNNVTLPNGLKVIDNNAFKNCFNLQEILLPKNLKKINSEAFNNCRSLHSITVPESVENIGNQVFENCENLNEVLLLTGKNTNFGSNIFNNTFKLKKIIVLDLDIISSWNNFNFDQTNNVYILVVKK